MRNLTTVNNAIDAQKDLINNATLVSDISKYATLRTECDYLFARGQNLIYLPQLATVLMGDLIAKMNNVTPEQDITVYPMGTGKKVQSLNASLHMVALYSVLISGHTDVKTIHTALDNWIDTDNVILEDNECGLLTEQLAESLVIALMNAEIIEREAGRARTEDGAYYEAYGITDAINDLRYVTIMSMWDKASPRMQPMRHALTWNRNGKCELKNFRMINGASKPSPEFAHSMNYMGHTAYMVNTDIRDELTLWLERDECPELPENETEALKVMNQFKDKVKIVEELLELPIGIVLYFPHTADWRGRAYARGGLTQFQSIKECRSMLDFAAMSTINTDTARKGLYLHVANAFGRDKLSINGRMLWVHNNHDAIMAGEFDEGIYSLRAKFALQEVFATGQTNIICHIDGTCNGTQWTAAMYRDEKTAALVNVMAAGLDDTPQDLYGVIAETAAKLATGKEKDALIKFNRDLSKAPIMVLGYGAGEATLKRACADYLTAKAHSANGDKVYKAIMTAISLKAPAVTKLTKNLKRILKASPKKVVDWFVPDLQVHAEINETEHLNLHGSSYTAKLNARILTEQEEQDLFKSECDALARGISPNYVHSLDSAHLRAVNRVAKGGLSCIHDSIGCPAHRVLEVNQIIREQFYYLNNECDLVANIYSALNQPYKRQVGKLDIKEVLEASYIFS